MMRMLFTIFKEYMMYTIYSKAGCPNCDKAKMILKMKSLPHEVLMLGKDYNVEDLAAIDPNRKQFPFVLKDGVLIGGFEELKASV